MVPTLGSGLSSVPGLGSEEDKTPLPTRADESSWEGSEEGD